MLSGPDHIICRQLLTIVELYSPANLERPLARICVRRPAFREPGVNLALLIEHDQGLIDIVLHVLAYGGVGDERDRRPNVFHDAKLERSTDPRLTCCRRPSRSGGRKAGRRSRGRLCVCRTRGPRVATFESNDEA